jgi:UvrD/REP helicase N-terminal domain
VHGGGRPLTATDEQDGPGDTPGHLWDEVQYFVKGRALRRVEDYLALPRTSRGTPLRNEQRRDLWEVAERYRAACARESVRDFGDLLVGALRTLQARPLDRPYAAVVVDEAQDLTEAGLRMLLAALRPGGELLLVGDGQQSICRQPALGTNVEDDPESHRTVISDPSTSVTTPLRVATPTRSDSTSTRSPTSTMSTFFAVDATRPIKCPQAANRPQEVHGWSCRLTKPAVHVIPHDATQPDRSALTGRPLRPELQGQHQQYPADDPLLSCKQQVGPCSAWLARRAE